MPTEPLGANDTAGRWLRPWIERWRLRVDGEPVTTPSSILLPVIASDKLAMLKVALIPEEVRGAWQLAWWDGHGAANVIAIEGDAVLLERATGGSLAKMATSGRDEEATSIICRVGALLHRRVPRDAPPLVPLSSWCEPLIQSAARGDDFALAAATAERLLVGQADDVSLHGDLHHHNVLNFGEGDWRAIDPKGLRGDRAFDFVHLLRNPDAATANAPGRLEARVAHVALRTGLRAARLLSWALTFSGLSAIWSIEDHERPDEDLALLRRTRSLLEETREVI